MAEGEDTKREVLEQPTTWRSVLTRNEERIREIVPELADPTEAVFFGAGSSYYLALSAAAAFQKVTGIDSKALPSSEVLDFPEAHLSKGDEGRRLAVGISRSGESTETVQGLEKLNGSEYSVRSLGITCYPESPLEEAADESLLTEAAQEESVVMTRSFTSMLLTVYQLATELGSEEADLSKLVELGEEAIGETGRAVEEILEVGYDHFVFLGSGPNYGVACESSLKMKETALENTEAYHALEFRHGPKSVAGENSLVVLYLSNSGRTHERELVADVDELGAGTAVLGTNLSSEVEETARFSVDLRTELDQYYHGVLFLPLAQQLGYRTALKKGLDPDEPRNLTQVVRL